MNVEDVLSEASAQLKEKYDVFEYKVDAERPVANKPSLPAPLGRRY